MAKRRRTILFCLISLLFLLVAPSAVLYSQGYRFDFETKQVLQTGAFYFKISPSGSKIYLDGELKGETTFFSKSLFIDNLLPKTYEIEIKKQGYYPWKKNLSVKEKEVTEGKNIFLFPLEPDLEFVLLNCEAITANKANNYPKAKQPKLSPDFNKEILNNDHEIWILFLGEQYDQPSKKAGEKVFLTRFSEKIQNVLWLNNYYLILNIGDRTKIIEIDNRDRLNIIDVTNWNQSLRSL